VRSIRAALPRAIDSRAAAAAAAGDDAVPRAFGGDRELLALLLQKLLRMTPEAAEAQVEMSGVW
jgi:hypothetical protein